MKAKLAARIGRFWHEYTRMRTAIFLLLGILVIVLIGSFVPQQNTSDPTKVEAFLTSWPNLNILFSDLQLPLTQVFVSPVFYVLLGLLYVSLGWCVIRRARALIMRTVRGYKRTPQYWGEWGSWLFHSSFFLLLIAVVWGKATGYQGLVTLTEGQSFTNTPAGYDTLQQGLFFNGNYAPFTLRLNNFEATYAANGEASDYVSNVSVLDHGKLMKTQNIRVNDFLSVDNVNVYQQDYGWAPTIIVTNPAGQTVFDGPIQFFDDPNNVGDKALGDGVLKVPDFNYTIKGAAQPIQIGAKMSFFPDATLLPSVGSNGTIDPTATTYGPGGVATRNPVIEMQLYVGNLGLNSGAPQNVNQLDTSNMQAYFSDGHVIPILLGQTATLPIDTVDGKTVNFTISFPAISQYSLFQVNDDQGVLLVYTSFILIMTGLLTKLYLRPFLERRQRKRRKPITLDRRWSSESSGEPQPDPDPDREPAAV
ncbi:MAG TPA: cytochrome c biogenesis protein ResB [Candidatus Dormibacteraeota bacterium]